MLTARKPWLLHQTTAIVLRGSGGGDVWFQPHLYTLNTSITSTEHDSKTCIAPGPVGVEFSRLEEKKKAREPRKASEEVAVTMEIPSVPKTEEKEEEQTQAENANATWQWERANNVDSDSLISGNLLLKYVKIVKLLYRRSFNMIHWSALQIPFGKKSCCRFLPNSIIFNSFCGRCKIRDFQSVPKEVEEASKEAEKNQAASSENLRILEPGRADFKSTITYVWSTSFKIFWALFEKINKWIHLIKH